MSEFDTFSFILVMKCENYVENCNMHLFFGEKCNLIYMIFFRRLFDEDEDKENVDPSSSKPIESVVAFHTPGLHGRNLQAT